MQSRGLIVMFFPLLLKKKRIVVSALLAFVLWAGLGGASSTPGEAAQDKPQPPCYRADVPAHFVVEIDPLLPPIAKQQGISGAYTVRVHLDATGKPQAIDLLGNGDAAGIVGRSVRAAADASTYATAFSRCQPVASTFTYRVDFEEASDLSDQRVSIADYFVGRWRCDGTPDPFIYERSRDGLSLLYSYQSDDVIRAIAEYSQDHGIITESSYDLNHFRGQSFGWAGDTLTFTGVQVLANSGGSLPSPTAR